MEQRYLDSFWQSLCHGLQSHAHAMGMNRTPPIQHLIHVVAQKVCSQPSPQSQDELNRRMTQRMVASAIIGSLSHGDSMVQDRPSAYTEMLEESGKLAEYDVVGVDDPNTVFAQIMMYSAKIGSIIIKHPARLS